MTEAKRETRAPRVLVVDDSAVTRRQLRAALEAADMSVVEAAEGVEALQRAREQAIDLILTDIHMPTMDGVALVEQLRASPGYERVPIYVLTTNSSREQLAAGRRAGVTAWLIKPAPLPDIVEAIRKGLAAPAR